MASTLKATSPACNGWIAAEIGGSVCSLCCEELMRMILLGSIWMGSGHRLNVLRTDQARIDKGAVTTASQRLIGIGGYSVPTKMTRNMLFLSPSLCSSGIKQLALRHFPVTQKSPKKLKGVGSWCMSWTRSCFSMTCVGSQRSWSSSSTLATSNRTTSMHRPSTSSLCYQPSFAHSSSRKRRRSYLQEGRSPNSGVGLLLTTLRVASYNNPVFAIIALIFAVIPASERERNLRMKRPNDYHLLRVCTLRDDSHPGILWPLPVEISYYFCIPLLVVVVLKLGKLSWLLAFAGYGIIFYSGFCMWGERRQHGSKLIHYPTFLCGSLAAMAYSSSKQQKNKRDFVFKWWHTALLRVVEGAVFALLLSQLFDGVLFAWVIANPYPDANHVVSFPVTVVIVCEMLHPGPLSRVLDSPFLCYAGKVSFSMYLLHVFIIYQPFLDH